ncbi:MAG: NADH-quinone oxidoreductase subunit A [Acidobacteriota bacterium]|nr:NADH-quinone oxidoreductase subunit A [Acidobacteriota bacterium]
MILSSYAVVGLIALLLGGGFLLASAIFHFPRRRIEASPSWKQYTFGFATYSLIFLAFDMEMIFMYPWAVVFAGLGLVAFLDMLIFIALLSASLAYAWRMGALEWE